MEWNIIIFSILVTMPSIMIRWIVGWFIYLLTKIHYYHHHHHHCLSWHFYQWNKQAKDWKSITFSMNDSVIDAPISLSFCLFVCLAVHRLFIDHIFAFAHQPTIVFIFFPVWLICNSSIDVFCISDEWMSVYRTNKKHWIIIQFLHTVSTILTVSKTK